MNRKNVLSVLFALVLVSTSVLSGLAKGNGSAVAAPPTPSSLEIDGFILETDNVFGYQILRPASWTPVDLVDRRGYQQPNSAGRKNRIMLAVTNLKTVSDAFGTENRMIANYELFRQNPSLIPWMSKTEALWASNGIQFELVLQLPNAMIYAVHPSADEIQLIAYTISQDQPLGIVMHGLGRFNNLQQLKSNGLLADFETIVNSASAYPSSSAPTAPMLTSPMTTFVIESGPFHSDSGYRSDGAFTFRLQTDYYQAAPRLYWLYEYTYYAGYKTYDSWLYRTDVTDNPVNSCNYGGNALYERSIEKMASRTTGIATDSYTPNVVVAHLNTTTAHMMVFGNPMLVDCQWYFPFTSQ